MNEYVKNALIFTILIPAVVGMIRYNHVNKIYRFFIWYIWLGALNEIISLVTSYYFRSNAFNTNVFTLLDALLVIRIFYEWKLFRSAKWIPLWLSGALIIGWIIDNFITGNIKEFNSWFPVIYSFILTIMSIVMLNKLFFGEKRKLLTNPMFLVCIGMIIGYTYIQFIELFWRYSMNNNLSIDIYDLYLYVNLLTYIIYTYAILCMNRKLPYTQLS